MSTDFPAVGFAVPVLDAREDHGDLYAVTEGANTFLYTVHNVDRATALVIGLLRGAPSVWDLAEGRPVPVLHFDAVPA